METFSVVAPRQINLENFKNKDTLTKAELETLIKGKSVEIFTQEGIDKFISISKEKIEKSEDIDKEDITKAIKDELATLQPHRVEGKIIYLRMKKNDTLEKSEDIEELTAPDIIKSQISDCFSYGTLSKIEFAKKGSDVKASIQGKITSVQAELADLKTKMATLSEKLPLKPSEPLSDYNYSGMKDKVGALFSYPYQYTYFSTSKPSNSYDNLGTESKETVSGPTSQEEAEAYQVYNMLVQQYCRRAVDVEYLTLFMNNLSDSKSYSFNVAQLVDLGIDK